ncbi:MAG: hypothetical protein KF860_02945 [Cyclobacteriaceae bacterium]|nr:hypothetical protein [Cyclobacteriaceae bacterium]
MGFLGCWLQVASYLQLARVLCGGKWSGSRVTCDCGSLTACRSLPEAWQAESQAIYNSHLERVLTGDAAGK